MAEVAASSLLKPLATIMLPIARKLRAERSASRSPFQVHHDLDPLDQQLGAALARLGAIDEHMESWKKLLIGLGGAVIRPDFFQLPSVRTWLSDDRVQADFKLLARTRLIGGDTNIDALNRIRGKYSDVTGEVSKRATYAIVVVLAVLQVSAESALTDGEKVITGMLRDSNVRNREDFDHIKSKLDQLVPITDPLHGEYLQTELNKICSRRGIPGIDSTKNIEALIARIENGTLSRAPNENLANAYYWAARLLAPDSKKTEQAENYLATYRRMPSVDLSKVSYVNGWLKKVAGHTQDAISIFSKLNTSDARTSIILIIAERDGKTAALEWLEDHRPYDHTLLNFIGWRNVIGMMAESGAWEEGLSTLQTLPVEMKETYPDLLFVEGLLHAGCLLPEPIRGRLLTELNIDFKGEVQGGQIASNHRNSSIVALERARDLLFQIGADKRANGCDYHLTWIRLVELHPKVTHHLH